MIFITGPLYSGKRTFAQGLPGTRIAAEEMVRRPELLLQQMDRQPPSGCRFLKSVVRRNSVPALHTQRIRSLQP